MSFLLFYGDMNGHRNASLGRVIDYFDRSLSEQFDQSVEVFRLSEVTLPFFNPSLSGVPGEVNCMLTAFRKADFHIWFTPLYHGSMTGAMKNALDWLELTRTEPIPYLSDKCIGLVSLSDGLQSMQAINAMEAVAKSLRAWTVPFSIPMQKTHLWNHQDELSEEYVSKFNLLIDLMLRQQSQLMR